jgi:hypothetical protein
MHVRLVKHNGLCRVQGRRDLEHNHDLLDLREPSIPDDLERVVKDLLKVGVDKNRLVVLSPFRG